MATLYIIYMVFLVRGLMSTSEIVLATLLLAVLQCLHNLTTPSEHCDSAYVSDCIARDWDARHPRGK